MKINIYEGYLAMFELLDDYYQDQENQKNIDSFASLLGSMDPYLFEGGYPIDQAVWEDWKTITQKCSFENELTEKELLESIILFLEFYKDEFEFDLQWVINEITSNSVKAKNALLYYYNQLVEIHKK